MLERLSSHFTAVSPARVFMFYGPGVEDIYLNAECQELHFEAALFETLQAQGYERIVFFTMHRSVYFYDDRSRDLSRPPSLARVMLQQGPLPGLKVYHPPMSSDATTAVEMGGLMGDLLSLRMLDALLRQEDGPRTALIFPQAETTFRYFEDPRSLAGLIGEWVQLSPANPNAAIFIFAAEDYSALARIAESLPVPELRNLILRQQSYPRPAPNLCALGGPDTPELLALLSLLQQRGARLNESEAFALAQRLALSGQLMRYWLARLAGAPALDLVNARQAGWIPSSSDLGLDPWDQLDRLVGLAPIKLRLREQAAWVQLHRAQGSSAAATLHMIFTGNPGTGKTTVARLLGEIYLQLGVLRRGHLVEVRGSDLIAEYVGGTAIKTNTIVDRALEGVLFIDEAYTLVERDRGAFGQEALDTLLTRLEEARDRLVIIAAGYPEPMRRFRTANPGLSRRFPEENVLVFPDFDPAELWRVLQGMLSARSIPVSESAASALQALILALHRARDEGFGNAGEMRNLAEALDRRRAARILSLQPVPEPSATPTARPVLALASAASPSGPGRQDGSLKPGTPTSTLVGKHQSIKSNPAASPTGSPLETPTSFAPHARSSRLPLRTSLNSQHARRLVRVSNDPLEADDIPPVYQAYLPDSLPDLNSLLSQLDALVGLEPVKAELRSLLERLQLERLRAGSAASLAQPFSPQIDAASSLGRQAVLRSDDPLTRTQHFTLLQNMLFVGNPGTGKTTVARLLGQCFRSLGLLTKGHIVEVSRADLVAGFVGQTAMKTMDKVKAALDGVLFIDEAYALDGGSLDFGREAIDTLVKAMEDYKHRLLVIAAGYPLPMQGFLMANPGLESRFPLRLEFPDFTSSELIEILQRFASQAGYLLASGVDQSATLTLQSLHDRQPDRFGNARAVLHLFERLRARLAQRVLPQLQTVSAADLPALLNTILPEDVPSP